MSDTSILATEGTIAELISLVVMQSSVSSGVPWMGSWTVEISQDAASDLEHEHPTVELKLQFSASRFQCSSGFPSALISGGNTLSLSSEPGCDGSGNGRNGSYTTWIELVVNS